jgi:cell division protease FtsH
MPWLLVPLLLVGLFLFNGWLTSANTKSITYSEFTTAVQDGKIADGTTVTISDTTISGTLVNDQGDQQKFSTTLSPNFQVDQAFTEFLDTNNVNYEFQQPSVFLQLILNILPFALIMGLVYWFVFRRVGAAGAGPLNMGKNKVKIYDRKEMKTTFADVAGVDEAKDELREIVEFLSNPKKYQRLGDASPRACCCSGPPGAARRCSLVRSPARPTCPSSS